MASRHNAGSLTGGGLFLVKYLKKILYQTFKTYIFRHIRAFDELEHSHARSFALNFI